MAELRTTSEVIDALDGTSAVSELTGANPSAVSNWRGQEVFPAWTYITIKNGLAARDKAAPDWLWAMTPPVSPKRRKSGAGAA